VIVVVGSPTGRIVDGGVALAGLAAGAARAAAAQGAAVQLVGRVGDDAAADSLLLALAASGVGHVAVLRDPARATPIAPAEASPGDDPAAEWTRDRIERDEEDWAIALDAGDVELGLRYLTEFSVLVLVPPAADAVARVAVDGAEWASARLVLVVGGEAETAVDLPPEAIVLEAPSEDPDDAFATVVGRLAAALDAGASPEAAFASVIDAAGWAPASEA
jgi:hypothetical protein